jgi:hypothetical protein
LISVSATRNDLVLIGVCLPCDDKSRKRSVARGDARADGKVDGAEVSIARHTTCNHV